MNDDPRAPARDRRAERLPPDHPERVAVANEVHARPYEALQTPQRAEYLALTFDRDEREREIVHLVELCRSFNVAPPMADAAHFSASLGPVRVKWERHTEFSGYTFFAPGDGEEGFGELACSALPDGWLAAIRGKTIVAARAKLAKFAFQTADSDYVDAHFGGNVVVGAEIGGTGAGVAFTDFQIDGDGFVRFLVLDRHLVPRQAGRMLQRLFEIESYRVMALLALPVARSHAPQIAAIERSLATLTAQIARDEGGDEALLAKLTGLAAAVESAIVASQYRFGASRAYYELVRARIAELKERSLPGIQTIDEFMERRLAPAMATCFSVSERLRGLSDRVAQASGLLSTRVEIAREKQNQSLLASMDQRAKLQLRLQQTVEGLSVAAITYYVVGLVGYAAKGLKAGGVALDPEIAMAAAIPIVVIALAMLLRRVRRKLGEH
ncbi:MAG TPA: DUF3422 domain-containing protein [Casimicrobiaceae bacterium]|nr:DUF3422 domain-containing protein [Casimicrobiaceae bacterium]